MFEIYVCKPDDCIALKEMVRSVLIFLGQNKVKDATSMSLPCKNDSSGKWLPSELTSLRDPD